MREIGMRFLTFVTAVLGVAPAFAAESKPNIVYVLCDDLGYGDLKCLNPEGKIATPNLDRLAAEGMIFTDAHSRLGRLLADALRHPDRPLRLAHEAAAAACSAA